MYFKYNRLFLFNDYYHPYSVKPSSIIGDPAGIDQALILLQVDT
jgi:hypothetical protein